MCFDHDMLFLNIRNPKQMYFNTFTSSNKALFAILSVCSSIDQDGENMIKAEICINKQSTMVMRNEQNSQHKPQNKYIFQL